jgi:hypothetical protein
VTPPDRRLLVFLTVAAIVTRIAWVTWIHPTDEFVFRDMRGYVVHASYLAEHGLDPHRSMAFQAWGTYYLLALPVAVFGPDQLGAAAILWGLMGAAAVPVTYLLASRVLDRAWLSGTVGVLALVWYPNLANTGVFTAEAPLLGFLVLAAWRLVVLLQDGTGGLTCGLCCAGCVAIRPETLLFFSMALLLWLAVRGRSEARAREVWLAALPILLVLAFSSWHFHRHTGRLGIAESAAANLTPARCHHPWVQAFESDAEFERSQGIKGGRVFGVIPLFEMNERLAPDHPFALRPAFGSKPARFEIENATGNGTLPIRISQDGTSIKYVGHRADPEIHAAIVAACRERTGWREQARTSLVNLSALWFFNSQWPDNARGGSAFLPWSNAFILLFQLLVWVPMLIGLRSALHGTRRAPDLALVALPLLCSMIVSTIWFGSIRLRTPYDPFALLLAAWTWARAYAWLRNRSATTRVPPPGTTK